MRNCCACGKRSPHRQSEAWLEQIASDFKAGEILYNQARLDAALRCQALAKFQQVAEKCIKALVAAIVESGVRFMDVTTNHVPRREIAALLGLRRALDAASIRYLQDTLLTAKRVEQIIGLCELAPQFAGDGQPNRRNTEYPFLAGDGSLANWYAPASEMVFTWSEVEAAHQLAWVLPRNVETFLSVSRQAPER